MKLEPWQADLLVKLAEGQQTLNISRQMGKSSWANMLKSFMNKPAKRFQLAGQVEGITSHLVLIEDYMWWTDNERAILNWMADNLPRGIEHQQGMVLTFDSEQDRMMFLLRWS